MRHPALLRLALLAAFALPWAAPAASPPDEAGWVTRAVQAPRVSHHVFPSAAAGGPVSYHLYTPAAHAREGERRFPVVYWLHGSGGGLPGIPVVARLFDAAIAASQVPACFIVFVNGLPGGMYLDWKDGSVRVESMLIQDLLPRVDATHRTVAARGGRVIEGFSMGGYGAARLGFSHPDLFAGVSLLGAGPLQPDFTRTPRAGPKQRDELYQRVYGGDAAFYLARSPWTIVERQAGRLGDLAIRQAIGDRDETFANNVAFHERMRALGVAHTWRVAPGVGHDPTALIRALGDAFWAFHRAAFGAAAGAQVAPKQMPP
jgi:S-formylglutathione hydrolase FrmB